jgi:peptidylprolyl isomerase
MNDWTKGLLQWVSRRARPALLAALALAGSAAAARADVVARLGNVEVGSEELQAYLDTLPPAEQAALAKDPTLLSQVVRTYLARLAVIREARAKKWDQDPPVKAKLDRVRDQALSELYLQSVSRPRDGYPSEPEIKAAYDASPAAFAVPRQYRLAQTFVAVQRSGDREADARAQQRASEVARKARQKGADFGAVARASSEAKAGAPSGEAGSKAEDLGWLSEAELVPGIRPVVTSLAKDAVSDPVRLDDGWHVVKLLDVRPASVRPLDEVRDALASQLRTERAKANRQAYLTRLLDQNPPVVNELALSKLLAKQK